MDINRIDNHKLMYHPERVADWIRGKNIYPIYAEISPSGSCNHRCIFCALDFMEYKPNFIDSQILKTCISELSRLGLKSIMFAGEGEPLLHNDIASIIEHTKQSGIDIALTTNGVLLNQTLAHAILKNCTWIKVSIDAGTAETYSKIHRTKSSDFDKVITNLDQLCRIRNFYNYKCTIGAQLILLPENSHEVQSLAIKLKQIGVDYLVLKPYSQHPLSKTKIYKDIHYVYDSLSEQLSKLNDTNFNVIFRTNTIEKWNAQKKPYTQCQALPFWTYITASGDVYGCSMYLKDDNFKYGNINENTFQEIWEGKKRHGSFINTIYNLDTTKCRVNCRMDEINRYLHDLTHPSGHVNFI